MKAFETSERYAGKVRECCNYAARTAKNFAVGDNNKKRQACGPDEKILASNLKADLSSFADIVEEEEFTANQSAYILSNLLTFIFMLISGAAAICVCFFAEYAQIILVLAAIFAVLAFLSFLGAFGGTSKNVTGTNIIARRNPSGDLKKRIIIEANLDAPFKRTLKPKTIRIFKFLACLGIILYFVFDIVCILISGGDLEFTLSDKLVYLSFPLILFAFLPLALSRSVNANASFPGVVDNLLGCYTAAGALRYMSEMDLRLESTEICILLTGAKNAGRSGIKNYCKLNIEKDLAIPTTAISLDTIYNPEKITVITSGKSTTDILAEAATNAEVDILSYVPKHIKKNGSMKIFKKNKYSCATITSLEEVCPPFFGTAKDNEENINIKAIESTMKLVLEAAYAVDAK